MSLPMTKTSTRTAMAAAAGRSRPIWFMLGVGLLLLALACSQAESGDRDAAHQDEHGESMEAEALGPNGRTLLRSGAFDLELGIFDQGEIAELRAWASRDGEPIGPERLRLNVALTRLGGRVDRIDFRPRADHLVSSRPIGEPHSFEISIEAEVDGVRQAWSFEQFEGRTRIDPGMAASLGVASESAGPATLAEVVTVYGRVRANPERVREIRARFDGTLHRVLATVGDRVSEGAALLVIESNDSLRSYTITSPLTGIVTQRDANPGEQSERRLLMTVTDTNSVWVDLAVFPIDRSAVAPGQPVSLTPALGGVAVDGAISRIGTEVDTHDQSVTVTVEISESAPQLLPGTFVTGQIRVGEYAVPLAVRRKGIQTFRDWSVVYAQVGDEYEVRMLELGRSAGDWVEVLSGLDPGTRYVTHNSHLIKADIEKSGATHSH
jgi:cobalt-zinc-cadmium efflux system membrane fusion protein